MQADFKTSAPLRVANVRDCGAVGDGVADDTLAFQKAIDAGGAVSVPRGVYVRNDYWFVPKSEPFAGTMHDIRFARVRGRSMLPNAVVGNGVGRIERVVFDDCDVRVKTPKGVPQGELDFFSLSASDTEPWLVQNSEVSWSGLRR